ARDSAKTGPGGRPHLHRIDAADAGGRHGWDHPAARAVSRPRDSCRASPPGRSDQTQQRQHRLYDGDVSAAGLAAGVCVSAGLAAWLIAASWLSIIDLRTRTLPTRIIWSTAAAVGVLLTAAALLAGRAEGIYGAALGALACSAPLAVVHFAHPPSMGFGDVRFAVLNGMLCGWWHWALALAALAASFLAASPDAVWTMTRRGTRASRPLGPYLALGTAGAVGWAAVSRGVVPV
ncbi:MAG: prepilin peptidase, partial [Acidimicrobiales bacterium]|nr:prepilin peptidase [Acidimicrobiales bacterium]